MWLWAAWCVLTRVASDGMASDEVATGCRGRQAALLPLRFPAPTMRLAGCSSLTVNCTDPPVFRGWNTRLSRAVAPGGNTFAGISSLIP